MNRIYNQFIIGFWASAAVGLGILSRSWETTLSIAAVGSFFIVGGWAIHSLRSDNPLIRRLANILAAAVFIIFVFGILSVIERLYLVNAPTYPKWLVQRDIGALTNNQLMEFYVAECKGMGAEMHEKENGTAVIRCGGMMWYDGHTYLVHPRKEFQ